MTEKSKKPINLTDNDIIKALEQLIDSLSSTQNMIAFNKESARNISLCLKDLLDLINRQKAEIEELRKGFTADADYFASEYDSKIKSEAIKQFVERSNKILSADCREFDFIKKSNVKNIVKTIAKGMVGGNEVQWSKQGKCPITPEQFNAIYEDKDGDDE